MSGTPELAHWVLTQALAPTSSALTQGRAERYRLSPCCQRFSSAREASLSQLRADLAEEVRLPSNFWCYLAGALHPRVPLYPPTSHCRVLGLKDCPPLKPHLSTLTHSSCVGCGFSPHFVLVPPFCLTSPVSGNLPGLSRVCLGWRLFIADVP